MEDKESEGGETSGSKLPTKMHAATRARLADTQRLILEGVSVDQALKQSGMSRSSFYRLRQQASLHPGEGGTSSSRRFAKLKYDYGRQIVEMAMATPFGGVNAYATVLYCLGHSVSSHDVKLILAEKGLDCPVRRMMWALLHVQPWGPQVPDLMARLLKSQNTMPVMMADAIPSRRMVAIEHWVLPPHLAGRKDCALLLQYNPMTFSLRMMVADTRRSVARGRLFHDLLPHWPITMDEIRFLHATGAVAGRSICPTDNPIGPIGRCFQDEGYSLRLHAPDESLITRALAGLSDSASRWVVSELTALRKRHPAEGIGNLVEEAEKKWNQTARVLRGGRILTPGDVYNAKWKATHEAWHGRHRIEGGVNAAAQMDLLLTIGEQLLMHVKEEVWTRKCVEMINECGNSPQSRISLVNNIGQLVVTVAALVHPNCRLRIPESTGGTVAYRTEPEYASSILNAARSQGHLTGFYETDVWEWFRMVFRPQDYHNTFAFLPPVPAKQESQKSQKSQNGQGS